MPKVLFVVLLAFFFLTSCADQAYAPDEIDLEAEKQLVMATFDSIFVAFSTRDTTIVREIFTEDCRWTERRRVRDCMSVNGWVHNLINDDKRIHIDSTQVDGVSINGQVAWIILANNQAWEVDGETSEPKKWSHSGVLVKQGGQWEIAQYHGHNTTK